MKSKCKGWVHAMASAALAIAPAALATSTVTTFLDPPEDFVPTLPVAVSASDYGEGPELWPCPLEGRVWDCAGHEVELLASDPETARITYKTYFDGGWVDELGDDGLVSSYLEGFAIHFVESDGTVKEILRVFLESADSSLLEITYLNSLPDEDFGNVPDDAFRVGRDDRFTLIGLDISIDGRPEVLSADSWTDLSVRCYSCVVVRRVPEPTTLVLLGLGLVGLGLTRRRMAI